MSGTFSSSWLATQVQVALDAFTDQLRSGIDGAAPVPNLEWTVADLGGHLACLPSLYRRQHELGAAFVMPQDFATFSDDVRSHITATDPIVLAGLVESEIGGYVAEMEHGDEFRWLYGRGTTAANLCAGLLSELTIHGRDLAPVSGVAEPILSRRQANAIVEAMMVITPAFVDSDKARRLPDGTYQVSFRGGNDYTWILSGGALEITTGRPRHADARLNADPATFVLSSMGRIGEIRAGLTGAIVAYGRKPWRLLALGNIAVDGF